MYVYGQRGSENETILLDTDGETVQDGTGALSNF